MLHLQRVLLTGAILLNLGGCSPQVPYSALTADVANQMMTDFRIGDAKLDCGVACSWAYITSEQKIDFEYQTQDWPGLAMDVMRIGNQTDIGYYYLGRSAEGLGYYEAADRYFRISGELSTTIFSAKCNEGHPAHSICNGFILPRDIYPRLAEVETQRRYQQQSPQADSDLESLSPSNTSNLQNAPNGRGDTDNARGTSASYASTPSSQLAGTATQWIDPPPIKH